MWVTVNVHAACDRHQTCQQVQKIWEKLNVSIKINATLCLYRFYSIAIKAVYIWASRAFFTNILFTACLTLSLALSLTLSSAFDKYFLSCFILFLFLTTVVELFFYCFRCSSSSFLCSSSFVFLCHGKSVSIVPYISLASFIEATVEQHDI